MKRMLCNSENTGVVILSAGLSERMGKHKALLKWNQNQDFISHITKVYLQAGLTNIIWVVTPSLNKQLTPNIYVKTKKVSILENNFTNYGRIYSIQLGINALKNMENAFIQNVDNPFIEAHLITRMMQVLKPNSYVNPAYKGKKGHPVLISRPIIDAIQSVDKTDKSLKEVLKNFKSDQENQANDYSLRNINTIADYNCFFE